MSETTTPTPPFHVVIVTEAGGEKFTTGEAVDTVQSVNLTDDLAEARRLQMRLAARYPYPQYRVTIAPVRLTKPWPAAAQGGR